MGKGPEAHAIAVGAWGRAVEKCEDDVVMHGVVVVVVVVVEDGGGDVVSEPDTERFGAGVEDGSVDVCVKDVQESAIDDETA